ncbi:hypothetical protein [Xenorhabdus bovienii]|nr:hypothetical protein [Xenorhabdus bovienii]
MGRIIGHASCEVLVTTRIFDLRHSTKIDTVGKVATAIGHQLTVSIE